MPSNHLIICHPLLLLPSIFPSVRVFSSKSTLCIRWPKYWSFSFNLRPSNEYSGLISFRIDWLDLLAVQGTPKSLLQHHSSKHPFFRAQPALWSSSHIMYMTTGKIIALTRCYDTTYVGRVKSLLVNMLSRFVVAFLPRSNCLLTRYFICLMCLKITEVGIKNPCFPDEESETQKAPPRSPSSRADMHTQVCLTISLMVSFISKCLPRDLPSFTLFLSLLVFPYLLR